MLVSLDIFFAASIVIFSDDEVRGVLHHRNETHRSFRFHETILSFGEPGSLEIDTKNDP